MSPRRNPLGAVLCVLALALAAPRAARGDEASEAQLQFDLGSEFYNERRYAQAVEHFVASNRIVSNVRVMSNIAQTYALMNRPVDAVNWYEALLAGDVPPEIRQHAEAARDALLSRVAVVDVHTDPAGAALFVDRVELGAVAVAPRRIALQPGSHRIVARLAGHHDAEATVDARVHAASDLALALPAIVGTLVVQSDPPGATVQLSPGGALPGTTPLEALVPIGRVEVRVALEGRADQVRTVDVREGQRAELRVAMALGGERASVLSVRSNFAGTAVRVGDRAAGFAPVSLAGLAPGRAIVEVLGPRGMRWSDTVLLEAGAATRVDVTLVDPRALPWGGWRFVGYGLGAAAFASGAAVGLDAYGQANQFYADNRSASPREVQALNVAADVLMGSGLVILAATAVIDLVRGAPPRTRARVTVHR